MKKYYETKLETPFHVETLIGAGGGRYLTKHGIDSPAFKDGRIGVVYDFWQLIYLEEGSYHCQIEGNPPCLIQAGQLILCEPRKIRFSIESRNAVAGIISFRCHSAKMQRLKNRLLTLPEEDREPLLQLLSEGSTLLHKVPEASTFRGSCPVAGTADYQLQAVKNRIELLLIKLYDMLLRSTEESQVLQEPPNHWVKFREIETYMQSNIHTNLTVDDILAASGLSLSTLKRIFRQQADCGIIHYFLKLKINEGKRLLLDTDLTVSQISDQLGFSSVHYFSNLFKKYTGVSPKQYAMFGISQQI